MEKLNTILGSFLILILAAGIISGCSKTAAKPTDELRGPKETIVMDLVDISNKKVGSVYVDNMNGRAQARISMDSGYYSAGQNLKSNITLTTTTNGTTVYANCTDVNGVNGKCSTFPIKVLKNNSDALYADITTLDGIIFNVMDQNNNVFARSVRHTIVIDN